MVRCCLHAFWDLRDGIDQRHLACLEFVELISISGLRYNFLFASFESDFESFGKLCLISYVSCLSMRLVGKFTARDQFVACLSSATA